MLEEINGKPNFRKCNDICGTLQNTNIYKNTWGKNETKREKNSNL